MLTIINEILSNRSTRFREMGFYPKWLLTSIRLRSLRSNIKYQTNKFVDIDEDLNLISFEFKSEFQSNDIKQLNVIDLKSIFHLWLFGLAFSGFCLFIEIVIYFYKQ